MLDQRLVDPEDVTRECRREVVDYRLAHRKRGVVAQEDVHAWAPRQNIPAGSLKYPEECRLIQVPECVTIIGVDDLFDICETHAAHCSGC
jgi:hypothetical protein